jgi:hypothetical protein
MYRFFKVCASLILVFMFYCNLDYYFKERYSELLLITTNIIYIQLPAIIIIVVYIYSSNTKSKWFNYFKIIFIINIFFGIFTYLFVTSKFKNVIFLIINNSNLEVKNISVLGRGNNIKISQPLKPNSSLKLVLTGREIEKSDSTFIKYNYEINSQKKTLTYAWPQDVLWNDFFIVKHKNEITILSEDVYVIDSLKN